MKTNKTLTKILSFILILFLLISASGCFKKNEPADNTPAPTAETAEKEENTPSETQEPEETIEPMIPQESTEIEVGEGEEGSF